MRVFSHPHYFLFFLLSYFVFIFSVPPLAVAASLSLSSPQTNMYVGDIFTVDTTLSISAKDGTRYYLRGVFYQDGTANYCGYTYNGNEWFNGPYTTDNGWQHLLPVFITNNSWSGQLTAKIDTTKSGCQTSGSYDFKVERFTSGGSETFDSQNVLAVHITILTPSDTPALTNTPSTTTIPTTDASSIQKKTTLSPTKAFLTATSSLASASAVLGIHDKTMHPFPTPTSLLIANASESSPVNLFLGISLVGFIFIGSGILLIWWKWRAYRR